MVIERAELRAYVVSAIDDGRILNPKTVRSQIIGGIAGGRSAENQQLPKPGTS
jgi:hypothetical protein